MRASQVDRQQNRRCGVGCGIETNPCLRVKRSRVAYRECRDREKGRGHDRGLGKCSGRFRKHPHGIWVRKVHIRQQQRVLDAARDSAEQLWEKLLENAGAGTGAAGAGQKLLDSAGNVGSAAGLVGTVARTVATRVL